MATLTDQAEVLRNTISIAPALTEEAREALIRAIDEALIAERRATVKRIRKAIHEAVDPDNWGPADFVEAKVDPILDEVGK